MKKVYMGSAFVSDISAVRFRECLDENISAMQSHGFEVEVQYQTSMSMNCTLFTAIILGYEMKNN